MRLDIARREKQRDWELLIAHSRSVEFCEATPFDLVDEPKEPLYGRETDRDLRSACRCSTWFFN